MELARQVTQSQPTLYIWKLNRMPHLNTQQQRVASPSSRCGYQGYSTALSLSLDIETFFSSEPIHDKAICHLSPARPLL